MKQDNKGFSKIQIKSSFLKNDRFVLGLGAELKANFCILKDGIANLYYGYDDLKNPSNFKKYKNAIEKQLKIFSGKPKIIAHDLNPEFLSTKFAHELKNKRFNLCEVRAVSHHYAHAAGALAALGILDKKVLAISCDGTGLGLDGKIWGCEFIRWDKGESQRMGHLNNFALPGADKAVIEPWRIAVSLLYKVYGKKLLTLKLPWIKNKIYKIKILIKMIEQNINSPMASSAGRLFDAVAAICGLTQKIDHEAQAARSLQQQAERVISKQKRTYKFTIQTQNRLFVLNTDEMIRAIVDDIIKKKSIADVAACFHNTFSQMLVAMCVKIAKRDKINDVVFSGGVFFNDIIIRQVTDGLRKNKFNVYEPGKLYLGDTGLSLGQAVLAAK